MNRLEIVFTYRTHTHARARTHIHWQRALIVQYYCVDKSTITPLIMFRSNWYHQDSGILTSKEGYLAHWKISTPELKDTNYVQSVVWHAGVTAKGKIRTRCWRIGDMIGNISSCRNRNCYVSRWSNNYADYINRCMCNSYCKFCILSMQVLWWITVTATVAATIDVTSYIGVVDVIGYIGLWATITAYSSSYCIAATIVNAISTCCVIYQLDGFTSSRRPRAYVRPRGCLDDTKGRQIYLVLWEENCRGVK